MFNLTEKEFYDQRKLHKTFPISLQVNGDELTPITLYYNLQGRKKFLLESVYSEKEIGRYSFMGADPYMTIKSYKDEIIISGDNGTKTVYGKVLDYVKQYVNIDYNSEVFNIPFTGGAIGYVGYDVVRQYEKLPDNNIDELKVPEANLMFYKIFICYDHFKHNINIVYNVFPEDNSDYNKITETLDNIKQSIISGNVLHPLKEANLNKEFESNVTEEEYCEIVERAKEYIKAGDIFQVVPSQRLKFKNSSEPFDVYRRLRSKNPSPYLFYIDFEDFQIAGSSPESLVSVKDNRVITNPIAGTRPRGKSSEEDEKLKKELLEDEKEKAEHLMLVDLGRNDIGRISEFGTVNVDRFMEIDLYSHVMHIVSMVSGELKKELNCFDALSSCLPVGTVSGAPKVRAMEIIDELENVRRGIYAGAVGYFSHNGNMDTCIAIRTIVFKDDYAYVQSGAGIVYDSDPKTEYRETLNKAMAMKEVI
ncbi:anthranilate synthase component 1 [Clostridium pasteurianum DSM 525 = ATCC 6013]|uniref:Anthranilate synthase component 1 n=1 Tax=Clostridium pasteurianum DSM 525 = ATCC 6013 TaxID=1262449 RepID=A0A0H3J3R7_CLOPA|nr:anthranilate synthase component I [Clostridium pasteurianum]AJA47492.1 anthranilate synthase component 1 [Clostridium pasteurianum DSM 525 = ATCC 6013]AJA51480.1 anthranilate synthase component 1 [Clostridium pasteurianum DSM 525 = ATCC 6013]AOZ74811.1 anthranilate synthase subunit I [Clostridium pasteurianum DSM 525 = ATCC 6013]AOZ78607.1 anthranilate synthase subunit I [Clostridium pasteurianum]ELP57672.1 anthranilate synthase component I [Clostridium pasteurianum DSM 525 = ATCC 6013]